MFHRVSAIRSSYIVPIFLATVSIPELSRRIRLSAFAGREGMLDIWYVNCFDGCISDIACFVERWNISHRTLLQGLAPFNMLSPLVAEKRS